jgi:hypothetical protein
VQEPAPGPPLPDAKTFLSEALKRLRSNDLLRSQYDYTETETRYDYASSGRLTKTRVRVYEVRPSDEPELTYRRLVSEDGVPPADLAKRDADHRRKVAEWTARRQREGQRAREARLRKEAEEDRKEQAVVDELPAIYDIRMTGREVIDGRPAIVFQLDPRSGYSPRTPQGRIIKNFRNRAWIDEQDHELARLTTEALDSVSVKFGFILRLTKGSRGHIERRKVDGETWLPTYSRFTGSGRVVFLLEVDVDQTTEYSSYRRREPGH